MKKNTVKSAAFILGAAIVLSGCGGSGDARGSGKELPELESEGKTLVFYSASANEQHAYTVNDGSVLNLQGETDSEGKNITNFNMEPSEEGRLFVWIDNKGDDDASNDEAKIIMFNQDYSYAQDGNATWEYFYYLGHFHGDHLAAHSNDEFDFSNLTENEKAADPKYKAIQRLNIYLAEQNKIEQNLTTQFSNTGKGNVCRFQKAVNDDKTYYYVVSDSANLYKYDENLSYVASTIMTGLDNCLPNESGMSATEDGVLYFSSDTQTVHSIDTHNDGTFHEHRYWNLEALLGAGKTAEMMVGIAPVTGEDEHDHN